jgi:hypothetical protein
MSEQQLPANFRWLEEGRIAGSGLPEGPEQVDALSAAGVRAVVSFHPLPEAARARLRERGIDHLEYPISSFTASPELPLAIFLQFVDERAYPAAGGARPVLFH